MTHWIIFSDTSATPTRSLTTGWLGILAVGLTGCAVGPTFRPSTLPKPPQAAHFGETAPQTATVSARTPLGEAQTYLQGGGVSRLWWNQFGSKELDNRVAQALQHSPTVASAQAALLRAQENLNAASGGRFPAVGLQADALRQKAGGSPFNVVGASVTVAYTLDLFGSVRRGIELQAAAADQQRWVLEGTYLTLAANVATASIREAALRAQLGAAEAVVELMKEQEALVRTQLELGAKGPDEVLASQANLAQAQAQLPGLRLQLETVRNQLYVYLGRFPSEGGLGSLSLEGFTLPRELPSALPAALVRQRPDVLAAEANVHGATARLGLATANLFPSLTLTGSYGRQASRGADLLDADMAVWSAGLNLLQPLFNGGSLRAQKRAAAAGLDEAVASYRLAVLNAFGNVADALNALQHDAEALQAFGDSEAAAKASLELTRTRYQLGAASYLQLIDATRLWHQARTGLIQAQAARLTDTTALYAALGGGWHAKTN